MEIMIQSVSLFTWKVYDNSSDISKLGGRHTNSVIDQALHCFSTKEKPLYILNLEYSSCRDYKQAWLICAHGRYEKRGSIMLLGPFY